MEPIIIAISGLSRSGKSSLSKELAKRLNCEISSFGGFLKFKAKQSGMNSEPTTLQMLGQSYIDNNPGELILGVLNQCAWQQGHSLVIDGIRHKRVFQLLKKYVSPTPLFLIHLWSTPQDLLTRLKKSNEVNNVSQLEFWRHPTEEEALSVLPQTADLILDALLPTDSLVQTTIDFLKNQGIYVGKE